MTTRVAEIRRRCDATVREVKHWHQPPDKRQDVDYVVLDLDFSNGEIWWLADKGTVKPGDHYTITVERKP